MNFDADDDLEMFDLVENWDDDNEMLDLVENLDVQTKTKSVDIGVDTGTYHLLF